MKQPNFLNNSNNLQPFFITLSSSNNSVLNKFPNDFNVLTKKEHITKKVVDETLTHPVSCTHNQLRRSVYHMNPNKFIYSVNYIEGRYCVMCRDEIVSRHKGHIEAHKALAALEANLC